MGIYIGIIEKKGYDPTVFFNFKPIAEITSNSAHCSRTRGIVARIRKTKYLFYLQLEC